MRRTQGVAEFGQAERKRVEAVVEGLATIGSHCESLAEVAHDARNMVTALGLYCDLLEEPGVLATPFAHYGSELRLVAAASRRLVEKLVAVDRSRVADTYDGTRKTSLYAGLSPNPGANLGTGLYPSAPRRTASRPAGSKAAMGTTAASASGRLLERGRFESKRHEARGRWDLMPAAAIENLAAELLANHNLLAALAGPTIVLTVDVDGGACPVRLTGEDLTRVLVNLVKNAAEAMPAGGRIQIQLHKRPAVAGAAEALALTIEDNGPGIPDRGQDEIFAPGYTTRTRGAEGAGGWPVIHRGLGLSITRSLVEASGGRIAAANRAQGGARFEIELPVRRAGR
jgi:signal transduction histidine kinase